MVKVVVAKECAGCGEVKPADSFSSHPTCLGGLASRCRDCLRAQRLATTESNRSRAAETRSTLLNESAQKRCVYCGGTKPVRGFSRDSTTSDGFAGRCKTCQRKYDRMAHERGRQRWRSGRLARKYGVDQAWYDDQFARQGGRCALMDCLNHLLPWSQYPPVDHHHASGQVREILCSRHNVGNGYFNENPRLLRQMAEYNERWRAQGAAGVCWAKGVAQKQREKLAKEAPTEKDVA